MVTNAGFKDEEIHTSFISLGQDQQLCKTRKRKKKLSQQKEEGSVFWEEQDW